ncbi:hypothetical protein AB5N19_02361 [Seiridium cardinale]
MSMRRPSAPTYQVDNNDGDDAGIGSVPLPGQAARELANQRSPTALKTAIPPQTPKGTWWALGVAIWVPGQLASLIDMQLIWSFRVASSWLSAKNPLESHYLLALIWIPAYCFQSKEHAGRRCARRLGEGSAMAWGRRAIKKALTYRKMSERIDSTLYLGYLERECCCKALCRSWWSDLARVGGLSNEKLKTGAESVGVAKKLD